MTTFEELDYEELPMIREEIWRWVSLADQSSGLQSAAAGLKSAMTRQQQQQQEEDEEESVRGKEPEEPQSNSRHSKRQQDTQQDNSRHRSKSPKRINYPSRAHVTTRDRDDMGQRDRTQTSHQRDRSGRAASPRASSPQEPHRDDNFPGRDAGTGRRLHEARGTPQRPRRVQPRPPAVDYDASFRKSKKESIIFSIFMNWAT